jgi:hypothetical protein
LKIENICPSEGKNYSNNMMSRLISLKLKNIGYIEWVQKD